MEMQNVETVTVVNTPPSSVATLETSTLPRLAQNMLRVWAAMATKGDFHAHIVKQARHSNPFTF